jgi:phage host-nuclease inhibitor protein Gam
MATGTRNGTRRKKTAIQVPQNETEAAASLSKLGDIERDILEISNKAEEEIARIELETTTALAPLLKQSDDELDSLLAFASSHRDTLLTDGKKSITFPTGTIGWRKTPLSVSIKGAEAVIAEIKRRKLAGALIRTKEEIDKQAMLRRENINRAMRIPGVTIGSREEFFAKPNSLTEEVIKGRKRKKKGKNDKSKDEDQE